MRPITLFLITVSLCAAYLLGRVVTLSVAVHAAPIVTADPRSLAATVVLQSWNNGKLTGVLHGSGRLIAGSRVVIPDGSGAFTVTLQSLPRTAAAANILSPGFVASKRGKRYYPAGSPAAQKLSPKNLLFFATSAEAEAAGFTKAN